MISWSGAVSVPASADLFPNGVACFQLFPFETKLSWTTRVGNTDINGDEERKRERCQLCYLFSWTRSFLVMLREEGVGDGYAFHLYFRNNILPTWKCGLRQQKNTPRDTHPPTQPKQQQLRASRIAPA